MADRHHVLWRAPADLVDLLDVRRRELGITRQDLLDLLVAEGLEQDAPAAVVAAVRAELMREIRERLRGL